MERTKFASSYATMSRSRYLTVRPSRTKRMYEPVTRALRSVFTLSCCRAANCFSVKKISSSAAAADGTGSRRVNLSASSKFSFVWNDRVLNSAGFFAFGAAALRGRGCRCGQRGASLNSGDLLEVGNRSGSELLWTAKRTLPPTCGQLVNEQVGQIA